jgi:hypothetical protein
MRLGWLTVIVVTACAPLNASVMSDRCRDQYDACLNGCRPPPGPVNGAAPLDPGQQRPMSTTDFQIDVASCTNDCNRQSDACR